MRPYDRTWYSTGMADQILYVSLHNCAVTAGGTTVLPPFTWDFRCGERWLITGPNGGGKNAFITALAGNFTGSGRYAFEPVGDGGLYSNIFQKDTALVSLETAAALIAEERANDESDYIEGGIDIGRTARRFLSEVLTRQADGSRLESFPEVSLCGVAGVLDRGLKYLSTGEIRRVLLCRSLLSGSRLLILSDPFAGLDASSRGILYDFFGSIMSSSREYPAVLLCMERFNEIPEGITHVLEFTEGAVSYCGKIGPYRELCAGRALTDAAAAAEKKAAVSEIFRELRTERQRYAETVPDAGSAGMENQAGMNGTGPASSGSDGQDGAVDSAGGDVRQSGTSGNSNPDAVSGTADSVSGQAVCSHRTELVSGNTGGLSCSAAAGEPDAVACVRSDPAGDAGTSGTAGTGTVSAQELVRMNNVTVAWDGHTVLDNLSWSLYAGEHWLIRGPNGSGKTTFLELITGDNMQVFCNDVSIFGRRRGTGETIWELKEKMGIVSYRLHLEYRMVGGTDLEAVLLSGLHDSIGLYEQRSQVEQMTVRRWLEFGGFAGREHEPFSSLSYGEQRAVLILRAAVKCPPLLILDEPCHGLDESHRTLVLNLLESIAETGTSTLLHVTHDPAEVLPCEKHILELHPGEQPMYRIIVQP